MLADGIIRQYDKKGLIQTEVKQIFSETNLKFYPLFYNHNIIIFISLRLKVLNFNISAFLFKV